MANKKRFTHQTANQRLTFNCKSADLSDGVEISVKNGIIPSTTEVSQSINEFITCHNFTYAHSKEIDYEKVAFKFS